MAIRFAIRYAAQLRRESYQAGNRKIRLAAWSTKDVSELVRVRKSSGWWGEYRSLRVDDSAPGVRSSDLGTKSPERTREE